MTSVPPLPMEASSAQVAPMGERPRTRGDKPADEASESGFAFLLAEVLPVRPHATKAEPAFALRDLEVEGGGVVAAETATTAGSEATKALPPETAVQAVKAAAPSLLLQGMPIVDGQVEGPAERTLRETLATHEHEGPAAADAVTEVAWNEEQPEAGATDTEPPVPDEQPLHVAGRDVQIPEFKPVVDTRATRKAQEDRSAVDHPEVKTPKDTAAPVTERALSLQTAAAPAEERTQSTRPAAQPAPRARGVEAAAEPKRLPETPVASRAQPPRAEETPVLEFQVRQQRPERNIPRVAVNAELTQAAESIAVEKPARANAEQPALTPPSSGPAGRPLPNERAEAGPAPAEDMKPVRPQPGEHGDPSRPLTQRVIAARPIDSQGDDTQTERDGPGTGPHAEESSGGRRTPPTQRAPSVNSVPAIRAAEPAADRKTSVEVPLKPALTPAPPLQPVSALQAAVPAVNAALELRPSQPVEEARPTTPIHPPNEPEIAAKLQQQDGRTTLNVVLQDERLGRVALQLVERGGWIVTAIRASDPRTAQTLANGAAGLFEALQHRGMTLAAGGGAAAWDAQEGHRKDNPQREQDSQRRRFRLRRAGGEFEGALARTEV